MSAFSKHFSLWLFLLPPSSNSLDLSDGRHDHASPISIPSFEDFDCDAVESLDGGFMDWVGMRRRVLHFDTHWGETLAPPRDRCDTILDVADPITSRPRQALQECPLGALSVLALILVCTADCGQGSGSFILGETWKQALLLTMEAQHADTFPRVQFPYLLGTSAWRVASLLAKLSVYCSQQALAQKGAVGQCQFEPWSKLWDAVQLQTRLHLLPVIASYSKPAILYDPRIDAFVEAVWPSLSEFKSQNADEQSNLLATCPLERSALNAILLLIRFLGPPIRQDVDPHSRPFHRQLTQQLGSIGIASLLSSGWPVLTILASLRFVSWRSQRVFTSGQLRIADVSRVREAAHAALVSGDAAGRVKSVPDTTETLRALDWARHSLWKRVSSPEFAASQLLVEIAKWLRKAPNDASNLVYLTMGWGSNRWVQHFVRRAVRVGIERLIFMTPEPDLLLDCQNSVMGGSHLPWQTLCLHDSIDFERPHDFANYFKFILLPVLLVLGLDVAWLDFDIFVIRDPTPLFISGTLQGRDVQTTEHWFSTCLNNGVSFVKASDRTLAWSLWYMHWLHNNPFSHDQNGWDVFSCHSWCGDDVTLSSAAIEARSRISHGVLDTHLAFVTLSGWSGQAKDISRAFLLHMTGSYSLKYGEKESRLAALFNASASAGEENEVVLRREHATIRRTLLDLRRPPPPPKQWCWEGVHWSTIGDDGA